MPWSLKTIILNTWQITLIWWKMVSSIFMRQIFHFWFDVTSFIYTFAVRGFTAQIEISTNRLFSWFICGYYGKCSVVRYLYLHSDSSHCTNVNEIFNIEPKAQYLCSENELYQFPSNQWNLQAKKFNVQKIFIFLQ